MASLNIMYGRREGQPKVQQVSIIPEGTDPREVTVLQPEDWNRIQQSLAKYNPEAERRRIRREERDHLRNVSKDMVKHWENTIEGQRQKKLEAREKREAHEEEERKKIDIEEAKHQAQKRKEAIERAKTLQYYQTDRVKTFHGALLLTEVLKERDAQVEMKKNQNDTDKIREEHVLRLQRRQLEEAIMEDQRKALKRFNERRAVADLQLLQVADHIEEDQKAKVSDREEGKNIKQQVEMYDAAKKVIEEQRTKEKLALMEEHQVQLADRERRRKLLEQKQEEEEEEIRQFARAKKKMAKMRKEKETDLFNAFQEHTERMRDRLDQQMKQKVDDEDERIAKAQAEREAKREAEEHAKQESDMKTKQEIHNHRTAMMKERERELAEQAKRDREILKQRVESDALFHVKQEEKKLETLLQAKSLKKLQTDQVTSESERKLKERKVELKQDKANAQAIEAEEQQFQEYASKVIKSAKGRARNPYPLIKAANEGPGGGRGPRFEGKNGIRPSYLVCDGTGVQLPNYSDATVSGHHTKIYGNPGDSRKRLGFTW